MCYQSSLSYHVYAVTTILSVTPWCSTAIRVRANFLARELSHLCHPKKTIKKDQWFIGLFGFAVEMPDYTHSSY